jgi:hypothetical protein
MIFENNPSSPWFIPKTILHRNRVVEKISDLFEESIGSESGLVVCLHGDFKDGKTSATRYALTQDLAMNHTLKAIYSDVQISSAHTITGFGSHEKSLESGPFFDFSLENVTTVLRSNKSMWPNYHQIMITDSLTPNDSILINKMADFMSKEQVFSINIMNSTNYNLMSQLDLLPPHEVISLKKMKMKQLYDIAQHRANDVHEWGLSEKHLRYVVDLVGLLDNERSGSCANSVSYLHSRTQNPTHDDISKGMIDYLDIDDDEILAFKENLSSLDCSERLCLQMITEYMCNERISYISRDGISALGILHREKKRWFGS